MAGATSAAPGLPIVPDDGAQPAASHEGANRADQAEQEHNPRSASVRLRGAELLSEGQLMAQQQRRRAPRNPRSRAVTTSASCVSWGASSVRPCHPSFSWSSSRWPPWLPRWCSLACRPSFEIREHSRVSERAGSEVLDDELTARRRPSSKGQAKANGMVPAGSLGFISLDKGTVEGGRRPSSFEAGAYGYVMTRSRWDLGIRSSRCACAVCGSDHRRPVVGRRQRAMGARKTNQDFRCA